MIAQRYHTSTIVQVPYEYGTDIAAKPELSSCSEAFGPAVTHDPQPSSLLLWAEREREKDGESRGWGPAKHG